MWRLCVALKKAAPQMCIQTKILQSDHSVGGFLINQDSIIRLRILDVTPSLAHSASLHSLLKLIGCGVRSASNPFGRCEDGAISVVSARHHGGIHAELAGPRSLVGPLGGSADRHHRPRRQTFWLSLPIKKVVRQEEAWSPLHSSATAAMSESRLGVNNDRRLILRR